MTGGGPVRVYVGATDEHVVPARVLEHSLRRSTTAPIDVKCLGEATGALVPESLRARGYTSFTFQRFAIPELQGFCGRAIYLDSDMLVFRDVRALWEHPFGGAQVLCVPRPGRVGRSAQFSVLVLDCSALRWDLGSITARLDRGELGYHELVHDLSVAERIAPVLPPAWNAMEAFDPEHTALLHYTQVETQPWLSAENPLGHLWVGALLDALRHGVVTRDLLNEHVARGHVRPSLLWQVDRCEADARRIPRPVRRRLDASFRPPRAGRTSPLGRLVARTRAAWGRWSGPARE